MSFSWQSCGTTSGDDSYDDLLTHVREILQYGDAVANLWQPIHGSDPETSTLLLRYVVPIVEREREAYISDLTTERLARQARSAMERLKALRDRLAMTERVKTSPWPAFDHCPVCCDSLYVDAVGVKHWTEMNCPIQNCPWIERNYDPYED